MKKRLFAFLTVLVTVLSLPLGVYAAEADVSEGFVHDMADILTAQEEASLETSAEKLADSYGCGVYVVTVSFASSGGHSDAYDYASDYYDTVQLGIGPDREGIVLLLNMLQRDYALLLNGELTHEAFPDSVLDRLEDGFLAEFADDQWMDGFEVYYGLSADALAGPVQSADPPSPDHSYSPVEPDHDYEYVSGYRRSYFSVNALVIAMIAAGVICMILTGQMKTARKQSSARAYIMERGVTFTRREDRFTHRTHRRRRVSSSSSSGGSRHRSGGGSRHSGGGSRRSGRSGKF